MISVTELRAGTVFVDKGEYYLVLSYEHIKMGRGSGTVKVKVKNLTSGATVEKSFITGARVEEASLERKKMQYLYHDNEGYHVMDPATYDQFTINERLIEDQVEFLKEGMEVTLLLVDEKPFGETQGKSFDHTQDKPIDFAQGKPIGVELPKILEYKIVQTGGSARGNTVGASYKDAVLENGLVVKVPLFIENGEMIRVDTRSGDYVERAK